MLAALESRGAMKGGMLSAAITLERKLLRRNL
jgi:hypothetical protein